MNGRLDPAQYRVTPDIVIQDDDGDLDTSPVALSNGTKLDEIAAAEHGRVVADRAAKRRGRPSLTGTSQPSPQVSTRVPTKLRNQLDAIAKRDGVKPSEVLRRALEEYVDAHR